MPPPSRRPPGAAPPEENARLPGVSPLTLPLAWAGASVFALSLGWFLYSYVVRFGRAVPDGPVLAPVLIDLGLFSTFALHHSLLARPTLKSAIRRWISPPAERSLYTWIASVLFLVACTWWQPVPRVLYRLEGVWAAAGYAVQLAAILLTLRGAGAVDVLELAGVRPALLAGAGRTAAHVPLETRGLYGFVRHPLYLAWALLVFGTPVMTSTRFVFAAVSTAYLALAIPFEERNLVDVFGAEYEQYRRRVRWRMIPFLY